MGRGIQAGVLRVNQIKLMIQYHLKQATEKDLTVLYEITQKAMSDVETEIHGQKNFTSKQQESHYRKYIEEFKPLLPSTKLIKVKGQSIGRLRVEESEESLFIGGIQLLPEYQRKGIGKDIFTKLILAAKQQSKQVELWVHKVNSKAIKFYTSLDFVIIYETENKYQMAYKSSTLV